MATDPLVATLAKLAGLLATMALCALALAGVAKAADPGACPNEAIRIQQGSESLPDCRAYELVSPAEKAGYGVGSNTDGGLNLVVAPNGDAVTYDSTYPLGPAEAGSWSGFLGMRGEGGWATASISKAAGPNETGYGAPAATDTLLRGSTPDGRTSVYWDCTSPPFGALWIRRADGSRQRIADATAGPPLAFCQNVSSGQPYFLGISQDGKHVVFSSTSRLGPAVGLPGAKRILYEWVDDGANEGAGTLRVVNRANAPTLTLTNAAADASLGGARALAGSNPAASSGQGLRDAISDGSDGHSRIFFQNAAPASESAGGGPLYMRIDGAETVQISAPEPGYTPVKAVTATGVKYLDASRDGAVVYFSANGDLVAGVPSSGGLYEYTADPDGAGPGASSLTWLDSSFVVSGLASADGSHFYATGSEGTTLYLDGQRRVIGHFAIGANGASNQATQAEFTLAAGIRASQCVSANVSPDGRYFAFSDVSKNSITGETPQVYRYDAEGNGGLGSVQLISTSPTAPPTSAYQSGFSAVCLAGLGRTNEKLVMSNDGQYVYFDTTGALAPGDVNGPFGIDTYRWHDGDVQLVSSGTAQGYASFQGTDASGQNAFFTTLGQLAPQDGDAAMDLYDARVDGGYLVPESRSCEGEGCQGPPAPGASTPPAASAAFAGAGNAHARKQKKARKHKQGAKKKHRAHKKHRKHPKGKGKSHREARAGKGGSR